jgi:hypothetical protein
VVEIAAFAAADFRDFFGMVVVMGAGVLDSSGSLRLLGRAVVVGLVAAAGTGGMAPRLVHERGWPVSSSASTLLLFRRFLAGPASPFAGSSGVSGGCGIDLRGRGEAADGLLLFGDGGSHETGLVVRVGAWLTFLFKQPRVAICAAEMASVVSFTEPGTKFLRLKFGSEPNCTSSSGGRWRCWL